MTQTPENRTAQEVNSTPIGAVALYVWDGSNWIPWEGATGGSNAIGSTTDIFDAWDQPMSLIAMTRGLGQLFDSGITFLGQVGGKLKSAVASITRPNDTTGYTAKDAVQSSPAAVLEFPLARLVGGSGWIVKARMYTNQLGNSARFRLWLFNVNNPAVVVDNNAYTIQDSDKTKSIGYIDFPAMSTEGGGGTAAFAIATPAVSVTLPLPFECAANDAKLYGLVEVLDNFTPLANQVFWLELTAEVN